MEHFLGIIQVHRCKCIGLEGSACICLREEEQIPRGKTAFVGTWGLYEEVLSLYVIKQTCTHQLLNLYNADQE